MTAASTSIRSACRPNARRCATRCARSSPTKSSAGTFDPVAPRPRRLAQQGVQPPHRRQGLDRHDLAEEIRRARAQLPRALCRHRGIPRRQRAGAAAFRRRPPERSDPDEVRARAREDGRAAAHLPRRGVLRDRHERAEFRLRPVRGENQGDEDERRLADQRHQDLDQQCAHRRLHDRPVPHLGRRPRRTAVTG